MENVKEFPIIKQYYDKKHLPKKYFDFKKQFKYNLGFTDRTIRHYNGVHELKINDNDIMLDVSTIDVEYEILTDYFVQEIRIMCRNINWDLSPLDYFNQRKDKWQKIYKKGIQKFGITKPKQQKQYLAKILKKLIRRDCDLFPIIIPYTIFNIFKPKSILDMSAGWGDRLLSSILYNPEYYVGVDPNKYMQAKYKEIIDFYANLEKHNNPNKYKVIESKFEDVKLDKKFDMLFSSPPFFIAEEYYKEQEYNLYNNVDDWLNKFMFPSLDIIWEHLNEGGFICLSLNDTWIKDATIHFTDSTLNYISKFNDSQYYGMIKFGNEQYVQPLWIYRKISQDIPKHIYNPEFIIKNKKLGNNTLNIIDESQLIGSFFQRGLYDYIKDKNNISHQYDKSKFSLGLSYISKLLNKNCELVTQSNDALVFVNGILGSKIVKDSKYSMIDKNDDILLNSFINALQPLTKLEINRLWMYKPDEFILKIFHKLLPKTIILKVYQDNIFKIINKKGKNGDYYLKL